MLALDEVRALETALASLDPAGAGYAAALYDAFRRADRGLWLFDRMGQPVRSRGR